MSEEKLHTRRPRHATEDDVRYITQIQGVLDNESDAVQKQAIIENINNDLRGAEVSLASNKKTSFVMQTILKCGTRDQLRLFLSYSKDFALHMFTQTYASHVMQTALEVANSFLSIALEEAANALSVRPDGEPLESLEDLIVFFSEQIASHMSDVLADANGSHVIRYLFCILMGCPSRHGEVKKHTEKHAVPLRYVAAQQSAFEASRSGLLWAIGDLPADQRTYLLRQNNASLVLQFLMSTLPADQRMRLADLLLEASVPEHCDRLCRELLEDASGSRSLESLLRSCGTAPANHVFISFLSRFPAVP